jgi:hypothetical protein
MGHTVTEAFLVVTLSGEYEPRWVVTLDEAPGLPALATLGGQRDPSV